MEGQQELQVSKIIQKNLHMRDKNGEPWRLTSQPRPQGGHPRARGNKSQMGYIQTSSQPKNQHGYKNITTHLQPQPRFSQ